MKNSIIIRRLQDSKADYKILEKWYQKEEIYSLFKLRILNYDEIKNKYYYRTKKDSKVPVFMIEYNRVPVGIMQYKLI